MVRGQEEKTLQGSAEYAKAVTERLLDGHPQLQRLVQVSQLRYSLVPGRLNPLSRNALPAGYLRTRQSGTTVAAVSYRRSTSLVLTSYRSGPVVAVWYSRPAWY